MKEFTLNIDRKILRWDEGLPLGNGEIGAIMYGESNKIVLSLDRGDVWDRSGKIEKEKDFNYATMVECAKSGNMKRIGKIFDTPYQRATPTKLPIGKLIFDIGNSEKNSFELDAYCAEGCFLGDNGVYFKSYIHALSGVGFIKTNAESPKFFVKNPKFGKKTRLSEIFNNSGKMNAVSNKLKNVRYQAPTFATICEQDCKISYFTQVIDASHAYGVAVAQKSVESGKGEREFAYYVTSGASEQAVAEAIVKKVSAAIAEGFDKNITAHHEWWQNFHGKSTIVVPDEFIQRCYNIGNYLLGSASRRGNYPMALQGLWTECDDVHLPPWKGDYHHDLNTELIYCSYLKANRLEQGLSFIDYIVSLSSRAEEFARSFYGAEGLCLPSVMDIDGYAMGGWAMYSLSPANQLWICQSIERHYTFTGDIDFLKTVAYPYISLSAKFVRSLLKKDKNGFLVLPISSSPEIHDNTARSFLTPNSNYDLALIKYIFGVMERFSQILGRSGQEWSELLSQLQPLAVNGKGELMLSQNEELKESHRHHSHAMSIFPLKLLSYSNENDKKIIDATTDFTEKLTGKFYTGYSFAWLAEFFVASKNGDKAFYYLNMFWKYFCSVNTFHLNGDYTKQGFSTLTYRPFTLEGNFCAQDVLQEMLLYSENGKFEVFPAIPAEWKDVEFATLRGWGGVLVSAKMQAGVTSFIKFEATNDVKFEIKCELDKYIVVGANKSIVAIDKNTVAIVLKKDECATFDIK